MLPRKRSLSIMEELYQNADAVEKQHLRFYLLIMSTVVETGIGKKKEFMIFTVIW